MSRALEKYRALRDHLSASLSCGEIRSGSSQEEMILEEMDEWWAQLTDEERKLLNEEEGALDEKNNPSRLF